MKRTESGMTLIELMIVVTVIGILSAVAYPSYRDQVRRSNRTEGKVALEQRAQALEKCFTRYMRYDHPSCAAAQPGADGPTPDGNYNIVVAVPTTMTFMLTATPQRGQTDDAECNVLSIDEAGQRGIDGTGNLNRCW